MTFDPISLALAGVNLLDGIFEGNREKKIKASEAQRDAAMMAFSPWSKIDPNQFAGKSYATPSLLSAALSGAASGYKTGEEIRRVMNAGKNGASEGKESDKDPSVTTTPAKVFEPTRVYGEESIKWNPEKIDYDRVFTGKSPYSGVV